MQSNKYTKITTIGGLTVLLSAHVPLSQAIAAEKIAPSIPAVKRPLPSSAPDPRTAALLKRVQAAYARATTMTADFTYTVTSVKRQQVAEGTVHLKKPNLARINFTYLLEPAFPNLVASDGKSIYTFTPKSFNSSTRRFQPAPFDSRIGAQQASGVMAGGGSISTTPVSADGGNLRFWDATPIPAFFDPMAAIKNTVYSSDPKMLKYEGKQTLNGITYEVLRHYYRNGNIAGGEQTPFEQRLYIGPDALIHQYVLEFRSGGRPGVQVVRLQNIRLNQSIDDTRFTFTPPQEDR